jgi:hypothetical protein
LSEPRLNETAFPAGPVVAHRRREALAGPEVAGRRDQRAICGLGLGEHPRQAAGAYPYVIQQFGDRPRRARANPREGGLISAQDLL